MKQVFATQLPRPPKRPLTAYKTSVGSVCVIGGSYGMAGAAALAAAGAFAAGAGYVRMVCPVSVYPILAGLVPSAVFVPVAPQGELYPQAEIDRAFQAFEASTVCVIGPGLGESPAARDLLGRVVRTHTRPLVIDASALMLLADDRAVRRGGPEWVLTPHPGEAARLIGGTAQSVQADRVSAAAALSAAFTSVAVLKGAGTLVCDGERLYENRSGNAGMAKAGSGDVLAGIIGALMAEGLEGFDAACLGVYLHGKAGDKAAASKGRGLTAEDVVDSFPGVLVEYERRSFEKGAK